MFFIISIIMSQSTFKCSACNKFFVQLLKMHMLYVCCSCYNIIWKLAIYKETYFDTLVLNH